MNPYRKGPKRPAGDLTPTDRAPGYRAARLRLGIAAGSLIAVGLGAPMVARSCHKPPPPLPIPPALLEAASRFPLTPPDLRPATPLEPLLVADAPDRLAVTQPTDNALNIRPGEPIVVRFNRPMVEGARVGKPEIREAIGFTPRIPGRLVWSTRNTLTFTAEVATWNATRTATMALDPELRSLAGESVAEFVPRTVVFDAGPRFAHARHASRLFPGEPLELFFTGKVDVGALASQMLVYEVDGGRRMLAHATRVKARNERGLTPVELRLAQALEPGAHFAVALAPPIAWGGSSPRVVHAEIAPRPRIEGVDCPADASEVSACAHQGPPGQIVDVEEALRLLATEEIREPDKGAVEVRPALPGLAVKLEDKKRLVIRGDWDPGQVYEVRVNELRDAEGRPLARTAPLAVRSAGRSPEVRARSGRLAFELDAKASLPLSAIHVDRGEARVAAIAEGREIEAALFPSRFAAPSEEASLRRTPLAELVPSARPNRWGRGALPWLDGDGAGMAVLALLPNEAARAQEAPAATFAQRTDLGIDAKVLPRGVLSWVTSVETARPVGGARVTIADATGAPVAEVTTDAQGVAWAAIASSALAEGGAVRAAKGGDRAVIVIDPRTAMGPRHLGLAPGEAPPAPDAWVATVITDRGIVRPGETVHAKALVRAGGPLGSALVAPLSGEVDLRLFGPSGEAAIEERASALSSFGTADADFRIDADASPGTYRVEVRREGQDKPAGVVSFTVGDYRPPTFRVDVSAPAEDLVDRDPLRASVLATYMFGPPAAGRSARWELTREDGPGDPPRWSSYRFGPFDASTRHGTVASGDLTLDAEGRAVIDAKVAVGGPLREHEVLEVTVRDLSGVTTSARRRVVVRPASFEIGVRRAPEWLDPGSTLDVDAVVIDAGGAPAAGRKIEARIVREGWHRYWEWSGHARHEEEGDEERGGYVARKTQKREVVHRCALTSAESPVHCAWKAEKPGTYVLEAVTRDDRGRASVASQRVYVAGPGEHPDRDAPGSAITLTPGKRRYHVGETAEIAFESPFPDAEALITVEREGTLVVEERRVTAGGNVFRFAVTEVMAPNAFVSLALARPRTGKPGNKLDLDAPDLRVGLAEITVRPAAAPLTVRLDAPGASAPAGTDVPIAVEVQDEAGQGVAAEVLLFAVDEATLRVTGYELGDPLAGLFRRVSPSFVWEDLRRSLVSRIEDQLAPSAGGDGGGSEAARRLLEQDRFEPTPLWLPRLTTDAQGRASATLHLPTRPTQYRIMAVAMDEGTRAGRAERTIVAAMPLVVRPVLPAAVTVGDRFQAAAFVHNTDDAPAEVTVTPVVDGVPRPPQEIRIAARSEARVMEQILVTRAEDLVVRFEARTSAGAALGEARVAVSPRGRTARSDAVGAVIGSRELTVELPPAAAEGQGTVTLSVASHPFVGFDASLDAPSALDQGVEAAASSLIALAAHASLDTARRPGGIGEAELRARVGSVIARLGSLQHKSGGFGDFSAQSAPDGYLSAYALHALTSARRAGFTVPDAAVDRARTYLHGEVRGTTFLDRGSAAHDEIAFALRVLREANEPDADRIQALHDQRERLTPYGMAQLAMAMDSLDRRRDTLVLDAARLVLATREDEKKNAAVLRWYDGSARTLGAVLEAALAIEVGTPDAGRLATRIFEMRGASGGAWWSSHETSHALAALAAYAARVRETAPLDPTMSLDGAPLAPSGKSAALAWYRLPAARVAGAKHTLRVEVKGQAWIALGARWNEALGPADEVARGEVAALHRVLEDQSGKPLGPDAHVKLGDLVRVRLFLFTEHAAPPHLVVRDRLAGGLEAIDGAHETTPRASLWALLGMGPDDDVVDSRGHHAARTLDLISHRAFAPARATFHLASAGQGLRELTYGARATTIGTFVIPPSEVEALYTPAFVARSALSTLTVDP